MEYFKKWITIVVGFICMTIGFVFVLLPGPAVIFLPLGLALLSLHYPWAKKWLKTCQCMMRKSAKRIDTWILNLKFYNKGRN